MKAADGRDMMFAGAGLIWGLVTVFRAIQGWRGNDRRAAAGPAYAVGALPLTRIEYPATILAGVALAVGCLAYLVWSLWPI